jgi:hypothetical protein
MESPIQSIATTPELRFQLSLLRISSLGEAPTPQIEQVEELLTLSLPTS